MKTSERNPMIFARVTPEEKQAAQEIADAKYEGNLSMFIRIALRDTVAREKGKQAVKEEVAA